METTRSKDGTLIAFDRLGGGPPVIVVDGRLCDRAGSRPLAEELASRFTVINYDRRGRGNSGDTSPYAVEREVEDLGALIAEAGGTASLYGHSSGLVLHEPPYVPDREEERWISREFAGRLEPILAQGRRGEAVELLWTTMGMPLEMVEAMRDEPSWAEMEAMAPKTAYDSEVMGDMSRGGTVPTDLVGTVPALVLCGGASPGWMIDTATRIADAMPNGRLGLLEGEEHVVAPELLAPVLAAFLAD